MRGKILIWIIIGSFTMLSLQAVAKSRAPQPGPPTRLAVTENGHYLLENGRPFFYLGDTSWFLFAALDSAGVIEYLDDRRQKGFNAIQLHVTPAHYQDKNYWGESPYIKNDPTRFNKKYWAFSRWVVQQAQQRGLYCAIMVGHAIRVGDKKQRSYAIDRTDHARAYRNGWLIGNWFKKQNEKIIWVGSWDCNPQKLGIIENVRAQMEGIADAMNGVDRFDGRADYTTTFMTAHPNGTNSSSDWFHTDAWLDFNWIQSYGNLDRVIGLITKDYQKQPAKPTMLCEGAYEGTAMGKYGMDFHRYRHRVNGKRVWYSDEYGEILPWHVRYQAYQSVFAGGCGDGYGHRGLIQTLNEKSARVDAYNAPGGKQMKYLARLMNMHDFTKLVPDQSLILSGHDDSETGCIRAMRAVDKSYAYIYSTSGKSFQVDLTKLQSKGVVTANWYDPRTGAKTFVGDFVPSPARFDPPGQPGVDNDWVLIIEQKRL